MSEEFVGRTIRGYTIREKVSQGGQSIVYRGRHTDQDEDVALRVVLHNQVKDPELIKRFQMEAVIFFRLKHPHIIPMVNYWNDDDGVWIVVRWMEGGSLRDKIKSGPLALDQVATILDQVCTALQFAHEKHIIHRDIKPSNILFDAEGRAYVHDFGIAKRLKAEDITRKEFMVGSPAYLSPEQILKNKVTARTDIYSLGITLFESITGKHPYWDTRTKMQMLLNHLQIPMPLVRETHPDVPAAVDEVITKATAKKPEARYATPLELADAFRLAITGA